MRDILLAIVLAVLSPLGVLHPWIGVMLWSWVSLMSPHRMTYGFMYDAPVAMLTGVVTLAGVLFSKDPKKLPMAAPLLWLGLFTAWMCIGHPFSIVDTDENFAQLDKVLKIYLMTFIAVAVIHTRKQVDILIAVCALSVAFFGVKGGIFTIITGGGFRVRGEGGFIAGNNEVALALIMIVPLLYYFVQTTERKLYRYLLWASIGLCVVAALGTQSRGGLLGVLGMTLAFLARSQRRLRLIIPMVLGTLFIVSFMPDSWWERMATISEYKEDDSALGRLNAWTLAFNVAKDHVFGGGFYLETNGVFQRYAPNPDFIAVAHSIYFQVLGQHGFIGLALYLGFWFSTWLTCRWIARNATSPQDQALARMIEVSFAGFAVGGAFLNLAYFDGPYYLMAALVVIRYKLMNNEPRPKPALRSPQAALQRTPEAP
jgi:putative inorganic carbon (hco3(-)) transporter